MWWKLVKTNFIKKRQYFYKEIQNFEFDVYKKKYYSCYRQQRANIVNKNWKLINVVHSYLYEYIKAILSMSIITDSIRVTDPTVLSPKGSNLLKVILY